MPTRILSFLETPDFTKRLLKLMPDEEYFDLQMALAADPLAGNLIPGGEGLRKIRWRAKGHGKRGGVRIIYYFIVNRDMILMLDVYAKNEKDDLTKDELKSLVRMKRAEVELHE